MAPVFVSTLPTSCSISSSTYLCEQLFCVEEEQNMTGIFCLFCFLFLKDINDMFYFEIVLIFVFMVCSRCFRRSSVWVLHHVSRKFPSSPYRPVCVCVCHSYSSSTRLQYCYISNNKTWQVPHISGTVLQEPLYIFSLYFRNLPQGPNTTSK